MATEKITAAERAATLGKMRASAIEDRNLAEELLRRGASTLRGEGFVVAHVSSTMAVNQAGKPNHYRLLPAPGNLVGVIHFTREGAEAFAEKWNASRSGVPVRVISRDELLREVIDSAAACLDLCDKLEAAA